MLNEGTVASRSEFLAFLQRVGVGGLSTHPRRGLFIHDEGDILFAELSVDSLSLMEIAIGLEEEYELSLSPNELAGFTSVGSIWNAAARSASSADLAQ
jgi:hypothetical protein